MSTKPQPRRIPKTKTLAEWLSRSQVESLRTLRDRADAGYPWVPTSNRTRGGCIAYGSAYVLDEFGLVERRRREGSLDVEYRITDLGRAILNGRDRLDRGDSR